MLGRAGVDGDSSHPGHRETPIDHGPETSMEELLKVITEANGMPVLFVPSSNGRLVAVPLRHPSESDAHQSRRGQRV